MASEQHLGPGMQLGGYRIIRLLGRGGMGAVWLAEQLAIGRQVALKVLHPHRIERPGAVDKFLAEARTAARLTHPHLLTVHEVGTDAARNLHFFSMEFVDGPTLADRVRTDGPLPVDEALSVLAQAADGLGVAHRQGLVHRDVKPDNLLIDANTGTVKLADLGLVLDRLEGRSASSSPGARLLTLVGTVEYCAPEQARNPARAGPASDVWGLGCCLYYALLGRPPYDGDTLLDLVVRVATEPVQGLEGLPSAVQRLLLSLLAKNPIERPADGAAALTAIQRVAATVQPGASPQPLRRRRLLRRRR